MNPTDDTLGHIRAECFILADGAHEVGGKLYVLGGGWDQLYSPGFPASHPQLSLVMKLMVPWLATDRQHRLTIDLVDEDGRPQLPNALQLDFNVAAPAGSGPGDEVTVPLTATIAPLIMANAGKYSFVLKVDERVIARTNFRAFLSPQAQQPPAQ